MTRDLPAIPSRVSFPSGETPVKTASTKLESESATSASVFCDLVRGNSELSPLSIDFLTSPLPHDPPVSRAVYSLHQ